MHANVVARHKVYGQYAWPVASGPAHCAVRSTRFVMIGLSIERSGLAQVQVLMACRGIERESLLERSPGRHSWPLREIGPIKGDASRQRMLARACHGWAGAITKANQDATARANVRRGWDQGCGVEDLVKPRRIFDALNCRDFKSSRGQQRQHRFGRLRRFGGRDTCADRYGTHTSNGSTGPMGSREIHCFY